MRRRRRIITDRHQCEAETLTVLKQPDVIEVVLVNLDELRVGVEREVPARRLDHTGFPVAPVGSQDRGELSVLREDPFNVDGRVHRVEENPDARVGAGRRAVVRVNVDQGVSVAVDAVRVDLALEKRRLHTTVVDRVRRVPMVARRRRSQGITRAAGEEHQDGPENHNQHYNKGKPDIATLRSTTRRSRGSSRALNLLGRTCFSHEP